MKIATWNINSVRRRLPLVIDWLAANKPEVLCLQETKVQDSEFPAAAFRDAGYYATFRGMKGYNGVATLTRREPEFVLHGLCEGLESEGVRIVQTTIDGIPIVNTYVPQGYRVGTDKYVFKLEWFHRVRRYFSERLDPKKPAIWLGDLNVAPEPIDVYHPDRGGDRSRRAGWREGAPGELQRPRRMVSRDSTLAVLPALLNSGRRMHNLWMQRTVSDSIMASLYARLLVWVDQRTRRRESLRISRLTARAERRLR